MTWHSVTDRFSAERQKWSAAHEGRRPSRCIISRDVLDQAIAEERARVTESSAIPMDMDYEPKAQGMVFITDGVPPDTLRFEP